MTQTDRRQFLFNASKALGGLALIQASPKWAFATRSPNADLIHRSSWAMGTSIRVSMPEDEFTSARAENAFKVLQSIDKRLTVHDGNSLLMQMNASVGKWTEGADLVDVSRAAVALGDRTEGALDVTVLPAMRRLGFVPGTASASDHIDYRGLEVSANAVRLTQDGLGVDFGGIAKGYGVDAAVSGLRKDGVMSALIDAGGDLFAMGRPDADRPWKVGIRHPQKENDLIATIEVENKAVATSGIYMQTRIVDGKQVSHLINPATGKPVDHVVSATIIAPDTMTADALATATSVMKRTAAQALVESMDNVEGFWIYSDGSHYISQGLRSQLLML